MSCGKAPFTEETRWSKKVYRTKSRVGITCIYNQVTEFCGFVRMFNGGQINKTKKNKQTLLLEPPTGPKTYLMSSFDMREYLNPLMRFV